MCVHVHACVRACVRACVPACACGRACVWMYARARVLRVSEQFLRGNIT